MAKPPVFAELTFDAALARTREHRVLIVDAMAVWCGPCQQMDRTTWIDPAVVARLTGASRSFAIQIDVDRDTELAAQLEITAMPTLIAFVDGVEHDRLVGGRPPAALVEWIDLVERGERYEDVQRRARATLMERRARAPALVAESRYDDALVEYSWLWGEARNAKLVDEMRALAAIHEPARVAFTRLRDEAPHERLDDAFAWILLNQIIADDDATLQWFEAAELPPSRQVAELTEVAILPILIKRSRWRQAGVALADPAATFRRLVADRSTDVRGLASNLVRALYAAGRDERANDLEYEAEAKDPSPEMAAALTEARTLGRADRAK